MLRALSLLNLLLAFALGILLLYVLLNSSPECKAQTRALDAMQRVTLDLGGTGRTVSVADTPRLRAAGFQHICPAVVAGHLILFVYPEPERPTFHGRNLHADLDVVWIDASARVAGQERLSAGASIAAPGQISAVLELAAGTFERWGIERGDTLLSPEQLSHLTDSAAPRRRAFF